MTSDQKSKLVAKGVCLVLAVVFWWAVKTRLEPDFWQRAIADVKAAAEHIEAEKTK
jgi:hypothetical protein